jgi:hypothetical protein
MTIANISQSFISYFHILSKSFEFVPFNSKTPRARLFCNIALSAFRVFFLVICYGDQIIINLFIKKIIPTNQLGEINCCRMPK